MQTTGEVSSQAAVFIYKADATADGAWADAEAIGLAQGGIRAERHDKREQFIDGLRRWSSAVDPTNAFLCIYAHMGPPGMNCVGRMDANTVSWQDVASAIVQPIELLWLVGCNSQECLQAWAPLRHPVRHLLLATSASKPWKPLLRCFAAEISIKHIRFYDEMPSYLAKVEAKLAAETAYFRPSELGFVQAF